MKTLHLKEDLKLEGNLEIGYVDLYDRGGNKHHHKALDVPGYGLVPCAKKLEDDFTTSTENLALVINDEEDENPPYTSNIWITRSGVLHFGNWDELGRECDDERDEDGDTEDQDLEALFDSFDDPKKAAWMRLYYYSVSIEEYCEKYNLDFEQASVLENENAIIIPNPHDKTYKKLALDERMTVWGGVILYKEDIEHYRIFETESDDIDGKILDIDWVIEYEY